MKNVVPILPPIQTFTVGSRFSLDQPYQINDTGRRLMFYCRLGISPSPERIYEIVLRIKDTHGPIKSPCVYISVSFLKLQLIEHQIIRIIN